MARCGCGFSKAGKQTKTCPKHKGGGAKKKKA
jgi:hypothetical protein